MTGALALDVAHLFAGGLVLVSVMLLYQERMSGMINIFALHARSGEGKAQVELAQLNYLLPRLRGWGEAMSRLGAGIGISMPSASNLFLIRFRSSRPTSHCFNGIVLIRILITIHQSAKASTP